MIRYQPPANANDFPIGTIMEGRNGIYWIIENIPGTTRHQWVLYDGPLEESESDSEDENQLNNRTSLTQEVEPNRALRRSPAFYDLSDMIDFGVISNETAQPRTVRYDDNDNISYMSFSTDSVVDNNDGYDVYDGSIEEVVIDDNVSDTSSDIETSISEDLDTYTDILSSEESIVDKDNNVNVLDKCLNDSPVTLLPYDKDDLNELFIIYLKNRQGVFEKGSCLRKDEMRQFISSDKDHELPLSIMAIYKKPTSNKVSDLYTGLTGKPTGKLVVRIPTNNMYITYGSMKRVFDSTNKNWYALPLYGGLPRRVGNLGGIYGSSMHHGQIPGFVIYKLYTLEEIMSKLIVSETHNDFPHTSLHNTMLSLFELVGDVPLKIFINDIIDELIQVRLAQTELNNLYRQQFDNLLNDLNQTINRQSSQDRYHRRHRHAVYLPRSNALQNLSEVASQLLEESDTEPESE